MIGKVVSTSSYGLKCLFLVAFMFGVLISFPLYAKAVSYSSVFPITASTTDYGVFTQVFIGDYYSTTTDIFYDSYGIGYYSTTTGITPTTFFESVDFDNSWTGIVPDNPVSMDFSATEGLGYSFWLLSKSASDNATCVGSGARYFYVNPYGDDQQRLTNISSSFVGDIGGNYLCWYQYGNLEIVSDLEEVKYLRFFYNTDPVYYINYDNDVDYTQYDTESEIYNLILQAGTGGGSGATSTPTQFYSFTPEIGTSTAYSTSTTFAVGATGWIANDDYGDGVYLEVEFEQITGIGKRGNPLFAQGNTPDGEDIDISASGAFNVSSTVSIPYDGVYIFTFKLKEKDLIIDNTLLYKSGCIVIGSNIPESEKQECNAYLNANAFADDDDLLEVPISATTTNQCKIKCFDDIQADSILFDATVGAICYAGCYLFYPTDKGINTYRSTYDQMRSSFPFNFFYSVAETLYNLNGTTTEMSAPISYTPTDLYGNTIYSSGTGQVIIFSPTTTQIVDTEVLNTIRTLLGYAVYFGFGILLFFRVKLMV